MHRFSTSNMFERLNLFGIPISIRFNNYQQHKTAIGSLMTFIILVLLFVYSYSILSSCLNYQRPNVIYSENVVAQPQRVDLDPTKFSIAMGIQDPTLTHFMDEQIYYIDAYLLDTEKVYDEKTQTYQQISTNFTIKMEPCTPNHFQVLQAKNYFLSLNYPVLYCFPQNVPLNLEGQFGANVYRRLYLQVKVCQVNCKPTSVIQQKLSNVAFQLYYVNYAVQPNSIDTPFVPIGQNTFWQSGYSLFKNVNVYFQNTQMVSDFGLFTNSNHYENRLLYNMDRETLITKTDNKMYEIYINLTKNKEVEYDRTYTKMYSGFSQIGGIFNILFCIGCLVCIPFSRVSLEQQLMNQIFNFQEKREKKDQQHTDLKFETEGKCETLGIGGTFKLHSQQNVRQQTGEGSILDSISCTKECELEQSIQKGSHLFSKPQRKRKTVDNNQEENQQKKDEISQNDQQQTQEILSPDLKNSLSPSPTNPLSPLHKIKQSEPLGQLNKKVTKDNSSIGQKLSKQVGKAYSNFKVSLGSLINSKFNHKHFQKGKPMDRLIKYGIQKLYNQLDIFYIINKLIEIEKLKHLLLDDNQRKLFEFIPKPTIYLSDFEEDPQNSNPLNLKSEQDQFIEAQKQISQFSILQEDKRSESEKAQEAEEAFFEMYKNKKLSSKTNQKLIKLLDPSLIERFEKNVMNRVQPSPFAIQFQQSIQQQYLKFNSSTDQVLCNNKKNFFFHLPNTPGGGNEFDKQYDILEMKDQTPYPNMKNYELSCKNNSLRFSQY